MKQVSDTDIRADVRSHLARHRVDMQRANFRVNNGTVRMCGELFHLGGHEQPVSASMVESLERDIASTRGVRHTYFEFENWKRLESGTWEAVQGQAEEKQLRFVEAIPLADLLQVKPRRRAA